MPDPKQVEATLAPHDESLQCLIDFIANGNNIVLATRAATAQLLAAQSTGDKRQALHTLFRIVHLGPHASELVKNGAIHYPAFTEDICKGLWEICTLGTNVVVREELPELARRLRISEFNCHVELAKALATLF